MVFSGVAWRAAASRCEVVAAGCAARGAGGARVACGGGERTRAPRALVQPPTYLVDIEPGIVNKRFILIKH